MLYLLSGKRESNLIELKYSKDRRWITVFEEKRQALVGNFMWFL